MKKSKDGTHGTFTGQRYSGSRYVNFGGFKSFGSGHTIYRPLRKSILSRPAVFGLFICAFLALGATVNNIRWTQIWSGDRHGTGSKAQSSDGTGTNGNLAKFNSAGTLVDAGVAATSAAGLVTLTSGTSVTLTGSNRYFRCTAACSITVPAPSAGVQYVIYNADSVSTVITLLGIGSSARYESTAHTGYGTPGTGTMVSSGAVGDKVVLLGIDSTHYDTPSFQGTWTVN